MKTSITWIISFILLFQTTVQAFEFNPVLTEDQIIKMNEDFIADFNKSTSLVEFAKKKLVYSIKEDYNFILAKAQEYDQKKMKVKLDQRGSIILIEQADQVATYQTQNIFTGKFTFNHKAYQYEFGKTPIAKIYDQILKANNEKHEAQNVWSLLPKAHAYYGILGGLVFAAILIAASRAPELLKSKDFNPEAIEAGCRRDLNSPVIRDGPLAKEDCAQVKLYKNNVISYKESMGLLSPNLAARLFDSEYIKAATQSLSNCISQLSEKIETHLKLQVCAEAVPTSVSRPAGSVDVKKPVK